MGNTNKSYRIKTNVNRDSVVNFNLTQTIDTFNILSLKLDQKNAYRLMESNTGIIAGRVLANGGFGVPNAKISVFVEYENPAEMKKRLMYHFTSTQDLDNMGIRYNLLCDVDEECHQNVGTFPTKRILLDNKDWIDIFDTYYTYTTRTNNSGDYMIYGVPTGMQKVHMDVDLSDIGVLSQTPRDMIYKGYDVNLFDSPTKFKKDTSLASLAQIMSQDNDVYVYPFWGDTTNSETNAAITRCDINLSYKFEPTCVFMGSVISDTGENALSKKCVASKEQGKMSELMTGEGRIEMIRKTYDNKVESFSIKGDKVINENGVWCYQIPMNLDYVVTDEFGNTILSDNPSLGIPTRTRVRFRLSMSEAESDMTARKRARYLIPNNPRLVETDYPEFCKTKQVDFEFGSKTKDENFRDLMWNNVYTVKNYVPRLQKSRLPKNLRHTGIKMVNHSGSNNPAPFNNLRIKFNFTYRFLCIIAKIIITIVRLINSIITGIGAGFYNIAKMFIRIANSDAVLEKLGKWFASLNIGNGKWKTPGNAGISNLNDDKLGGKLAAENAANHMLGLLCKYMVKDGDADRWNFNVEKCGIDGLAAFFLVIVYSIGCGITLDGMCESDDGEEISTSPGTNDTIKEAFRKAGCKQCDDNVAKLYNCIENQLAQDNEVTSFNFYNDWLNGVVYLPLWYRKIKPKKKFLGIKIKAKDKYCATDPARYKYKKKMKLMSTMAPTRTITQPTSSAPMGTIAPLVDDAPTVAAYADDETGAEVIRFSEYSEKNCYGYDCHNATRTYQHVRTGFINEKETSLGDLVQYYLPTYFEKGQNSDLVTLFATDIVLLGSLNNCDLHGIPQFFKALESTTYNMPPDLMVEDFSYKTDGVDTNYTDEKDSDTIDKSSRYTEYTGADWGNLGADQSNYDKVILTNPFSGTKYTANANENQYDNGGLFYGLTCSDSYTKPKSYINLTRICEFGVSLDESDEILSTSMVTATTTEDSIENAYSTLTPDGFVSYDEIYNPDYRSMFATMNANFLKTKLNYETGLTEYDFNHLYVDNFDGSMSKLMQAKTVNGFTEKSNFADKANYVGNWNLEKSSDAYLNFRFGNYTKKNGYKIYYYDHNERTSTSHSVAILSANRIPRYENSFYFYFGLNEGKTALDKFNTEFFSDCSQEDNTEASYEMGFVGNSWCPEGSTDGFIGFKTTMELPIKIEFSDSDNSELTYVADNIQKQNFYFGTPVTTLTGYEKHILHSVLDNQDVDILPPSTYNIKITDGDGLVYKDSIKFYSEQLTYTVDVNSFSCKNNELDEMFEVLDSAGVRDWAQMFTNIAEYGDTGSTTRPGLDINRSIHGYITISNVSVDDCAIRLTPVDTDFFSDNMGTPLYTGASISLENGIVQNQTGVGYIGKRVVGSVTKYYFGVPYGEQKYNITIVRQCKGVDTKDSITNIVTVSEGMFKMYINGIDYDNIKNFKTGWYRNTLTQYETYNNMFDSVFDVNKMYGWNDLDNIGRYNSGSVMTPVMSPLSPLGYDVSKRIVNIVGNTLSTSYEGNGATYIPIGATNDYSNPYTWTDTFCYNSENWSEDYIKVNTANKVTYTDPVTEVETIVDVTRTDDVSTLTAIYVVSSTGETIANEDEFGNVTFTNTDYSSLQGQTFSDYRGIIDKINEIIEGRFEFVRMLKGALRVNYDGTTLSISYKSNEPPIKYLIVGSTETTISPGRFMPGVVIAGSSVIDTHYVQGPPDGKMILDPLYEESSLSFALPTLTYKSTDGIIPFEKPTDTTPLTYAKHPYYVAIQDNNTTTLPSQSNATAASSGSSTLMIDNFNTTNPFLTKSLVSGNVKNVMFGIHFYNKPMYANATKIVNGVDGMPMYGTDRSVSMNGFMCGFTHNGIKDTLTTTVYNTTIDTYTPASCSDYHETYSPSVMRMFYSENPGVYGEYTNQSAIYTEYNQLRCQYVEIPTYSGEIVVSDGYGDDYILNVNGGNSINFNETVFMNSHYTSGSDSNAKDDYINLSLADNMSGTYYIYRYNNNHPFNELDVTEDKYNTMPTILSEALPTNPLTSSFVGKTTANTYNIGKFVDNSNTIDKFFAVFDNGVTRIFSPVFELTMPRAIRMPKDAMGHTTLYITSRHNTDYTGIHDVHELFYISNFDFELVFKIYNTDSGTLTDSQSITVTPSQDNIVNIQVHDGSWDYEAVAIKIVYEDELEDWEHPYITDYIGITKLCGEQTGCTVVEV